MSQKNTDADLNGVELRSMEQGNSQELIIPPAKSSGCHISVVAGFILTFLAIAIAVLIGLIVHFASPGRMVECQCQYPTLPPVSEEQQWQQCKNMASDMNMCFSPCDDVEPTSGPTDAPTDAPTTPTADVRLPLKVIPQHYDLELTPDIYTGNPDTFSFSGTVRIYLKCEKVTDLITLQINKLEIDGTINLQGGGPGANAPMVESWSKDEEKQFLLVQLTGTLTVGQEYMLDIAFHGPLKPDLVGLYYSSYTSGDETRYIATTQLQPTDARKTFPCFDEPAVKATFNTTLLRKAHMKSLSNMNILRSDTRSGDWIADVYNMTVKMPTYLLAFIICDFEYTEGTTNSGTLFRVWSRPDAINQTIYALEKGIATIQNFEEYFQIPFPLPKQDMIAVPDFAAGAMENWGLIIYRETALLYDPQLSSASNKQRVAEVVVHELAHQWFGNLVTPVWWDDLWLNEGFASYMEYVGMHKIEPTWDMHDQFVERDLQTVLLIDSLSTSHPIYVPVNHPDEINEIFDRISYLKGASIIRMMNFFLGESTFRNGLSKYLTEFSYDNANHTDLWRYLGQQAIADSKNLDVPAIMNTWVLQMGYPVVTFQISGTTAQVTQQHFLTDPSKPPTDKYTSPYGYKWTVPLTYIESTSPQSEWETPTLEWMLWTNPTFTVSNLDSNADWLIGNVGEYGYYRVNYNMENWDALINQLVTDYTKIDVRNRAQIIDDAVNLGRSGYLDQLVGLRVTEYLISETHYIPWKAAHDVLAYFNRMLRYTEYYGAFKAYMLKQVKPLYDSVGYDYDPVTEPHLEKYKRTLAWSVACGYGDQNCIDQATAIFKQWMDNPDMDTLIKPDMKSVMYCNGIRNGGLTEWNFLYQRYKETNVAAEAARILDALACSQEPWILNRFMHYALDANEIRRQDAIYVIYDVGQSAVGRSLAWDFFRGQWDTIKEIWGSGFFAISNVITGLTRSFNTQFQLDQMLAFREQNPDLGAGTRAFEQALETVQSNIKWMEANKDKLGEWLISKT